MKLYGHRQLPEVNLFRRGPVNRLVFGSKGWDPDAVAALGEHGIKADWEAPGHVMAAVTLRLLDALEVEHDGWWETFLDPEGDHVVLTPAGDAAAAHAAADLAYDLVKAHVTGDPLDWDAAIQDLRERVEALRPSKATRLMLQAAKARAIPVTQLPGDEHHQLGWGVAARRIWQGIPGDVPSLGHDIAYDHERAKDVLTDTGLPLPRYDAMTRLSTAQEFAERIGYPVTLKPLRGRGGVTARVETPEELEAAYDVAKEHHRWIVVEEHIPGNTYEVLVVNGQVLSAIAHDPDGLHEDVTDELHPDVRRAAERAVRICMTDLAAVRIVAETLETPLSESQGAIVDLDPVPDHSRHAHRDAAGAILDTLLPDQGRIPLVAVTGTNGKTTTVRLINHILKYAGANVGMACTGAVEIDNRVVLEGDYSGPMGATRVLTEPNVTHAVCEVARGGLLRKGLGFDACDVGIFTNVARDHLGQGGIETVEQLAELKALVLDAVAPEGAAVLNADDPLVWAQRHRVAGEIIPFTTDPDHPEVKAHLLADRSNLAVTLVHDRLVLRRGGASFDVVDVADVPITMDGQATFNVENAMAAVAAAHALDLDTSTIRAGLMTFNPTPTQLPGRTNLLDLGGVKVLVDYGHNVAALEALAELLPKLATGRR
ncbi:MAG: Mur ligase family protein, partial [Candidatus Thermoplasmatota archaeon]|nr:Mur ligase family protein [Candidatus Thermoplasmatota archaeon]